MTHNEVFEVLEELSLPIAYDHFAEGESPDPPFLCFLYPRNLPTGADNTVYYQLHELDIELYTDAKDPVLEQRVERLLTEHEMFFHKSEVWIEEEKMYEVLYEVVLDLQYECSIFSTRMKMALRSRKVRRIHEQEEKQGAFRPQKLPLCQGNLR